MEYVEVELGGKQRKARLTFQQVAYAARDLRQPPYNFSREAADTYKMLRELAIVENDQVFIGSAWALQVLLWAALRSFMPMLKLNTVGEWIEERERLETERQQRANDAMTTLRTADIERWMALDAADEAKKTPPLSIADAAVQAYTADPSLSGPTVFDLLGTVLEARRVGGVTQEQRPNAEQPTLQ